MKFDKKKSLAEISGTDWGAAPPSSTFVMRERHEVRRRALEELSFADMELLIRIDFEADARILVPYALNRLCGSFEAPQPASLSLLRSILENASIVWNDQIADISKARSACRNWLNVLDEELSTVESITDREEHYKRTADILLLQNQLLASMVSWERNLGQS